MAQKTTKIPRLPLTDDYIFKRVFAFEGNESVLKDLLEAILRKNIKNVTIKNPEIIPYEREDKRGLLDIKAETDDGTVLDIEMQMEDKKNIEERGTLYLANMITSQLQVGDDYTTLKKSIVIFITNYNFLKRNSYHSIGKIKFDKTLKEEYVKTLPKGESYFTAEFSDSSVMIKLTKPISVKINKTRNVKATLKNKKLKITWKKVKNADGYVIKVGENKKLTKSKKTVNVKKNKGVIRKVNANKTYYLKVRAYKIIDGKKNFGEWSKLIRCNKMED